jgi:hypothetical protein
MTMTIDRTVAEMGRSMKKWDIMLVGSHMGQDVPALANQPAWDPITHDSGLADGFTGSTS